MRRAFVLPVLLLAFAGCGDPTIVDLTGVWGGSFDAPATGGTLTLTLLSTDQTVSGTFLMRYGISGGGSAGASGSLEGTRPSANKVAFTITSTSSGFDWLFSGQLVNGNRISGTWQSVSQSGINGTFEVDRQ
jgi:hypothetical protein